VVPEDRESKIFPEAGQNDVISCMALTADFLIYGTDMGGIVYFFLEDWATLTKFKHITGMLGSTVLKKHCFFFSKSNLTEVFYDNCLCIAVPVKNPCTVLAVLPVLVCG
jgi:hypothetical protein